MEFIINIKQYLYWCRGAVGSHRNMSIVLREEVLIQRIQGNQRIKKIVRKRNLAPNGNKLGKAHLPNNDINQRKENILPPSNSNHKRRYQVLQHSIALPPASERYTCNHIKCMILIFNLTGRTLFQPSWLQANSIPLKIVAKMSW